MIDAEKRAEKREEELTQAFNRFVKDTRGENELQVIIRGHLYVENEIDNLLKLKLEKPQHLYDNNFMFYSKLKTALALGLIPEENKNAYIRLNKIRNNFAHNLNYELTENDFTDLYGVFNSNYREKFKFITDNNLSLTERTLLHKFKELIFILWFELKYAVDTYELVKRRAYLTEQIELIIAYEKEREKNKEKKRNEANK